MYKLFNLIENKSIFESNSDTELIDKVSEIVIENEDYDFSIIGISDVKEYIEYYCDNLILVIDSEVEEFLNIFCIKVQKKETLSYVELMMDNHKCIRWKGVKYYVPEDISYSNEEEYIYNLLVDNFHV